MRLRIEHRTTFTYDSLISEAYTEMRLRPSDAGGQSVQSFQLSTEPYGEVLTYIDRFGNDVRNFDVLVPYRQLAVTAISEVSTPRSYIESARALSPLDDYDYLAPTRYAQASEALAQFAAAIPLSSEADAASQAQAMMHTIFTQFKYEPGATTVHTSATEVLDLKRGVCQDFAHVMIALCRARGLHARYVSGYLYSSHVAARDDAASHAWVDVFVPGRGWISFDPTHDCEQSEQYVRLGVGRDYADVPPTRGTYKGTGKEVLDVKVNVREI